MHKKIILVGSIQEKKDYENIINMIEIRNQKELNAFIKSYSLFGFCHGENRDCIKELFDIDENSIQLIDCKDFPILNKHSNIEEKNNNLKIRFFDEDFLTNSPELSKLYNERINNSTNSELQKVKNNALEQVLSSGIPIKQFTQFIGEESNKKNTRINAIINGLCKLAENKRLVVEYPIKIENTNNIDSLNFSTRENTLPTEKEFKIKARKLKNTCDFKNLGHAQNALANKYGYKDYNAIKPYFRKEQLIEKDEKYALIPYQNQDIISLHSNYGSIFNNSSSEIDFLDLLKQKEEICLDFRPLEDLEESKRLEMESKILKSIKTSPVIKILRSKININAEDEETQEILDKATIIVNFPSSDKTKELIGKDSLEIIRKYLEQK